MASNGRTRPEPGTLAALDEQLKALSDAGRAQERVIEEAREQARVARRSREEGEIREVLRQAPPAEVETLRKAERAAVAVAAAEEQKFPALIEAFQRLTATRPQAEAVALREQVFEIRRQYGPAVAALLEALAAVNLANDRVRHLEEQAVALCPTRSALRKAARLSTAATNLGMGRLAWPEFILDGVSSRYTAWKRAAKTAATVPANLEALLEPEGDAPRPTAGQEYARVMERMYGGGSVKAPKQEPVPFRVR